MDLKLDEFHTHHHTVEGFGEKKSFPVESKNVESSNLKDNPIRTTTGTMDNDIELEANPSGLRGNSPIEKQGIHAPKTDESGVRTNTKPLEKEH